jgi:metallo-beta-lactamase family protein
MDHSGFLPRLVKSGFRGTIYSTAATAEIARIAFLDYAHLQSEDMDFKRRRHEREGRRSRYPEVPLYTEADALAATHQFKTYDYGRPVKIGPDMEAVFHDAGHILGSAMIEVRAGGGRGTGSSGETDGGGGTGSAGGGAGGGRRTIVFSGDIGRWDKPILRDPTTFNEADYVVMESTYGDRRHEDTADIDTLLEEVIRSTKRKGGNVVVPSFAIGRTQEVLYHLDRLLLKRRIPHLPVVIDSPMALEVTQVYKRHRELFDAETRDLVREGHSPFSFPDLRIMGTIEESKSINRLQESAVIIAGSGMCTGGRIKHHLVQNISRHQSTILFVGYQAAGTLGREIVDGAQTVRILGQMYPVRAGIRQIHGFSAHADKTELLRWVSDLERPPRQVFITHGEAEAAKAFAGTLASEKRWPVSVPSYQDTVTLD